MLKSSIPGKFLLVWAQNAIASLIRPIPSASQIGITPGAASFNDGWPPLTDVPVAAGGVPPSIKDANGSMQILTQWDQWFQAGGSIQYDVSFALAIGGYPNGSALQSLVFPGVWFASTADNNQTNPDALPAAFTGSITGNQLTISAVASGALYLGSTIAGVGVTAGTTVIAFGTGSGGAGTYTLNNSQSVGNEAMTAGGAANWQQVNRIRLQANLTLFVATTGSDANTGLTSGSPFLTLQHAINVLCTAYDGNGFNGTIQLADGTYTGGGSFAVAPIGMPNVIINGNVGTPSNVVISTTSAAGIIITIPGFVLTVQNLKVQTTTVGSGLSASNSSVLNVGAGLVFGACAQSHITLFNGASLGVVGSYSIVGGAQIHWTTDRCSSLTINGGTITLTGTPAFSVAFAQCLNLSNIDVNPLPTFSGTATGTRYLVSANSVIDTNGAGASFLPGSVAGSTSTGGQYI